MPQTIRVPLGALTTATPPDDAPARRQPAAPLRVPLADLVRAAPPTLASTNQKDDTGAAVDDPSWLSRAASTAGDVALGVGKGLASTAFGLGKVAHDYTPIGRLSDAIQPGAFEQRPDYVTPTTTAQRVGFTGEQVAEFFVPASAASTLGRAATAATDAGLAFAQSGGRPVEAGVAGAISAVLPGAGAARRASQALETSAQKSMAQALGATKEWAKSEAAKRAPEMLRRGVGGSRPAMLDLAKRTAARVGSDLDDAYRAAASAGATVPSAIIQGNVQLAADALKVRDASGVLRVIPGTETVVQKLDELGQFVASLGSDIPVDKAAHIKRTWDTIVSKAGLFGPKATASATDSSSAWAIREAAGSFRDLLNMNPTLQALNAESAFWTGLKKVLRETETRTQAQSRGLIASVMAAPGAVAGAAAGGVFGAGAGALMAPALVKVLQSPTWRTHISGPLKHQLADALASGSAGRVRDVTHRMLTALPGQVTAP